MSVYICDMRKIRGYHRYTMHVRKNDTQCSKHGQRSKTEMMRIMDSLEERQ